MCDCLVTSADAVCISLACPVILTCHGRTGTWWFASFAVPAAMSVSQRAKYQSLENSAQ